MNPERDSEWSLRLVSGQLVVVTMKSSYIQRDDLPFQIAVACQPLINSPSAIKQGKVADRLKLTNFTAVEPCLNPSIRRRGLRVAVHELGCIM